MAPNRKNLSNILETLSNSDLKDLQSSVRPNFLPLTHPNEESKHLHQQHQDNNEWNDHFVVVDPAAKLVEEAIARNAAAEDHDNLQRQQQRTVHAEPSNSNVSYWDWPADVPDDTVDTSACTASENNAFASNSETSPPAAVAAPVSPVADHDEYWREDTCTEEDVDVQYHIDYGKSGKLGVGTKTTVRKALNRKTGKNVAVKSVRKVHTAEYNNMKHEANVLSQLASNACNAGDGQSPCPYIIKFHHFCHDKKSFHLILDMCRGIELYEYVAILAETNQTMSEQEAIGYVRQIAQAVSYCHGQGIVHRDLKLENIVHYHKNHKKNNEIRLLDFGLAARLERKDCGTSGFLTERVGSPQYVAPEVLNRRYTEKCDIWSLGIIAYALLCAGAPFQGINKNETYEKIHNSTVSFHQEAWKKVSDTAKDFIRMCLEKDPTVRPTAQQLLSHEWLQHQSHPIDDTPATTTKPKKKRQFKLLSRVFHSGRKTVADA